MRNKIRTLLFLFAMLTACEIEAQVMYTVTDSCNSLVINDGTRERVYPKSELSLSYTPNAVLSIVRVSQSTIVATFTVSQVHNLDSLYHVISHYMAYSCITIQCSGGGGGGSGWGLTGNTGTNSGINYIGTTDSAGFVIGVASKPVAAWNSHDSLTLYSTKIILPQSTYVNAVETLAVSSENWFMSGSATGGEIGCTAGSVHMLSSGANIFIQTSGAHAVYIESGNDLFLESASGHFTSFGSNLPTYINVAAAQADATMPTGSIYTLTTPDGILHIKY